MVGFRCYDVLDAVQKQQYSVLKPDRLRVIMMQSCCVWPVWVVFGLYASTTRVPLSNRLGLLAQLSLWLLGELCHGRAR
jgi:hypothetical protein